MPLLRAVKGVGPQDVYFLWLSRVDVIATHEALVAGKHLANSP